MKTHRLPPLNALRALEAIQETGSITGAARRLRVSHSAVSHQVKVLEDHVGDVIFSRRGRSLVLNRAGESLARVVHEAFDTIRHEVERLPLRTARTVSLAALPIVVTDWLLPRLMKLEREHPSVKLQLSYALPDRPATPPPDLEIHFTHRSRLQAGDTPILSGVAMPVAHRDLPAKDPQDLILTGPLLADDALRMWLSWFDKAGLDFQDNLRSNFAMESSLMLKQAVLQGLGVALCRKAFIDEDLKSGRLIALSDIEIDEDWCYALRVDPGQASDPLVQTVKSWLLAQAGS